MIALRTLLAGSCIGLALAVGATGAAAQEKLKLTVGTAASPAWSLGEAVLKVLKPGLEKHSGGRIEVVVHDKGSLCSEHACVEQMKLGQIDIATVSSGNVGAFGTTFDLINLPYLFKDDATADAMLRKWLSAELGERARKEMKVHMIALIPVGGFRNVVNTEREVKVPADLKGLKIRVTKSPTEFNLVKAWGAVPVPYDWAQLYEGLQSRVVQGMYLQDTFTAAGKFTEVVRHVTKVGAAFSAHPILMDLERYRKLPQWARDAIDRTGEDLAREGLALDMAWQARSTGAMKDKVAIYQPTDAEVSLWQKGAKDAWVAVRKTYDPALARRILQEQGQLELIRELEGAKAL